MDWFGFAGSRVAVGGMMAELGVGRTRKALLLRSWSWAMKGRSTPGTKTQLCTIQRPTLSHSI